ncbi:NEAT domain-containing protein [Metasolibacillus sp. FSL H7-0170]|uniref:NEAT domain-containing protein n=1 Tax=Metasolibacillus TaxID=2703677 RepID=UPI000D3AF64E|nr:NEAT domain-containing protein [Metasolibacillus fluoroglycofenilyticus]
MSKFQSRSTKIALASVLATSAIVPAVAASAETPSRSMPDGQYTIDFTITDTTQQLAKYIQGPATLIIEDGKYFIQLSADATVMNMLTKVEVDGVSVIKEVNGQKVIYIPVERPGGTVKGEGAVAVGGKEIPTAFELTLDPTTIKAPEAAEEEKVEFVPGKTFKQVKDGEYAITFDAYDPKTNKGDYAAITNHLEKDAKLIVKDGKYSVELTVTEKSSPMIAGLKVAGADATLVSEEGKKVYSFTLKSISDLVEAGIHVVVPAANMDKWYEFGFAINTANLDLPEVTEEQPVEVGEELPLYIYKDKTNEISVMSTYVKPTVTVTETANEFLVDLTFVQGQYLNKFNIEGATIADEKTTEVDGNTVKIYTIATTNLDAVYTATVDVSVDAGPVKYDSVYPVQLQFGGKINPFTDITKLGDYGNIVTLYSIGLFKEADKFNPNGKVKRSQFALMLNRYLNLDTTAKNPFKDVSSFDAETQKAVTALSDYGIMNGTSATAFEPTKEITRQQAAVIIYRVLEGAGYKATGASVPFKDVTTSNKEALTAIAELNALGIMTGNEGKFNPTNTLTRSQMAKVILNTLYVVEN